MKPGFWLNLLQDGLKICSGHVNGQYNFDDVIEIV